MRQIDLHPDRLPEEAKTWWDAWLKRSDKATRSAIAAWEAWVQGPRATDFQCRFTERVWKDLKEWLLKDVFHDKCAYCETDFPRANGHAEHYRPKGGVMEDKTTRQYAQCDVPLPPENPCGTVQHPGYFWLAYHWENLVPACEFCNSNEGKLEQYPARRHILMKPLTEAERDTLKGKYWPSPAWNGWYYLSSQDLDREEQPFIINPLNPAPGYEPRTHLHFGVKGAITAVNGSPIGQKSIEVYNLDSDKLRQRRQKAQEAIQLQYFSAFAVNPQDPAALADQKIQDFLEYREPYSTAALEYLDYLKNLLHPPAAAATQPGT